MAVFFAPGRTELAGNHTDHQNGRVLASAVGLGLMAEVEKNSSKKAIVESNGYKKFEISLTISLPVRKNTAAAVP